MNTLIVMLIPIMTAFILCLQAPVAKTIRVVPLNLFAFDEISAYYQNSGLEFKSVIPVSPSGDLAAAEFVGTYSKNLEKASYGTYKGQYVDQSKVVYNLTMTLQSGTCSIATSISDFNTQEQCLYIVGAKHQVFLFDDSPMVRNHLVLIGSSLRPVGDDLEIVPTFNIGQKRILLKKV